MLSDGSYEDACLFAFDYEPNSLFSSLVMISITFILHLKKKLSVSLSEVIHDEWITGAGLARLGGVARFAEVKFTSVLHEARHLAVTWQARLCHDDILRNGARFSEVLKLFGRI